MELMRSLSGLGRDVLGVLHHIGYTMDIFLGERTCSLGQGSKFFSCRSVFLDKLGKLEGIFPAIFFHFIPLHVLNCFCFIGHLCVVNMLCHNLWLAQWAWGN